MAKKTWIKIKRGLLEPKHRDALGIRIWLYLYILDNADWTTGKVTEWRDADAADDLQIPQRTIRDQRVKLENDGYIRCDQGLHKQIITVMNWTDPRLHSEMTINHGDNNLPPLDNSVHGDNHGDIHGDIHGYRNIDTPTSNQHITYHMLNDKFLEVTGLVLNRVPANIDKWDESIRGWLERGYTPDMIPEAVTALKQAGKYTIAGPWSLTNTLANIAMDKKANPEDKQRRYKEVVENGERKFVEVLE